MITQGKLEVNECKLHPDRFDVAGPDGRLVACCYTKDNAEHLVKCWNCHTDVLEALKGILPLIPMAYEKPIREAIAKAEN